MLESVPASPGLFTFRDQKCSRFLSAHSRLQAGAAFAVELPVDPEDAVEEGADEEGAPVVGDIRVVQGALWTKVVAEMVGRDLQPCRIEAPGGVDQDVLGASQRVVAHGRGCVGDDTSVVVADLAPAQRVSGQGQLRQVASNGDPFGGGRARESAAVPEPGGGGDRPLGSEATASIESFQAAGELGLQPIGRAAELEKVLGQSRVRELADRFGRAFVDGCVKARQRAGGGR